MKPDWDKLTAEFKDSATVLIADVDCTQDGGKDLCEEHGVQGFPTIKYGDPSDLQEYEGGRDFDSLKKHADGLGPMCSPANIDLCDDDKKKKIEEFKGLGQEKREAMIKEKEAEIAKLEKDFEKFVEGLQKQYTEGQEKKEKESEVIKAAGLGLLKAVQAHEKKEKKDEL